MLEYITIQRSEALAQLHPSNDEVFWALAHYPSMYMVYRYIEGVSRLIKPDDAPTTVTYKSMGERLEMHPKSIGFLVRTLTTLGLLVEYGGVLHVAVPAPTKVLQGLLDRSIQIDLKKRKVQGNAGVPTGTLAYPRNAGVPLLQTSPAEAKSFDHRQLSLLDDAESDAETCDSELKSLSISSNLLNNKTNSNTRGRKKSTPSDWAQDPHQPAIVQVFEHWQNTFGFQGRRLTADRRRWLKTLIANGYPVDRMLRAIDNTKLSTYHMGQNERNRPYNEIENIFRTEASVDALADRPNVTVRPSTKSPFHASEHDMSLKKTNRTGGFRF